MEFERNAPNTAEDIALADTPKVTLQPTHDIDVQSVINDRSHRSDGSFEFESESTAPAALASSNIHSGSHHRLALTVSGVIAFVFIAVVSIVLFVR